MHRILVVDDEIAVCDLLKDFLTLKGYEVYTVSDGYAAIMITAVPDQGIITESIDLGAYDYIRKPMDLKHVENVVIITINNMKNCTRSCHSEQKGRAISVL